jgi:hypothetical protein
MQNTKTAATIRAVCCEDFLNNVGDIQAIEDEQMSHTL